MASAEEEEEKLESFLQWLLVNKVELRGCKVKYCDQNKGFGLFLSDDVSDGTLLVVPLDLAITPMRVLQDPLIGPECRAMFEEGEVDDRFLMILFLMFERLRKNSSWKPYLDMLPTSFGDPLWFTGDELLDLKGTTLYRATELRKKRLVSLFDDKVKDLVKKLLIVDGDLEKDVRFEDFLWANSVFWSRALNIPLPRSYVFPQIQEDQDTHYLAEKSVASCDNILSGDFINKADKEGANGVTALSTQGETVWVEGLVPGIDFCNHDLKAAATWEVDGAGSVTGVPCSMYLLSAEQPSSQTAKEISISYGKKGNEELLYLYGFVVDSNPDDYVMVHYPTDAIQNIPFSESKMKLLEAQRAEMRCLLPKSLLDYGLFPLHGPKNDSNDRFKGDWTLNFSWSGQRKTPSYIHKLVFPEEFLAALRTVAMQEDELFKVSSLLEELVGSLVERQPTDSEVRAAVWEVCGDSGALQLLVDLLHMKMMDMEESSGTESHDDELLANFQDVEGLETHQRCENSLSNSEATGATQAKLMTRNKWSSIVYRRGQKELTRLFLREAEHTLQLSLSEGN